MYNNNNDENIYHQVGQFWAHFAYDMEQITKALNDAGYAICKVPSGDMVIMSKGDYDDRDFDELNDDDDDDRDDNIFKFPKEY